MTFMEPEPYDNESEACLCTDCDNEAAYGSVMCAACEWFGCTLTHSKH